MSRGLISAFTHNVRDAIEIHPLFPARHLVALAGKAFRVRVFGRYHFMLRPHSSDASTIRQVFRDQEYSLDGLPQQVEVQRAYEDILRRGRVPLIIDCGANIGAASVWFSDQYPNAAVIAVEPDPRNARACAENIRGLEAIKLIEGAIGGVAGHVFVQNPDAEAWAVQTQRSQGASGGIRVWTIEEIAGLDPGYELFIVKIDIEGFEADLFSDSTHWIHAPTVIYVEPHDWMPTSRRTSLALQQAMATSKRELLIRGENLVYI